MAKKIFCDVCGNEMTYDEVPSHLKGQSTVVQVNGDGNRKLQFDVQVKIVPENAGNGEHIDVCGNCRYYLLDRLDGRPTQERDSSYSDAQAANTKPVK